MSKDTGGPAFPHSRLGSDADGMTLRDYFAAKAMQAFAKKVGWESDRIWFEDIAKAAYRMADSMLKARQP
jgi:hypothetical protein